MKMYVVSGGPGTGKTSTVEELGKEFQILPEAARDVSQNDSRCTVRTRPACRL